MKDTKAFNPIEAKLISIFESFGGSEVGAFYISSSTDCERFDTKAELMEAVTDTLNEWFKERDVVELITDRPTMDCIGDYLPLFLALPNDTTVLAVGNGGVAAPTTTTAYLHESYNGYNVLAVYDYETNEEETKEALTELFPLDPPQWCVNFRFDNSDYDYPIIVGAEDRTEALIKAIPLFNNECDWCYMPYKSIDICEADKVAEFIAEAETEPKPEFNTKVYACNACDSIYTGGGIWCTVYQCSGTDSDIYYAIDNTFDDFDGMAQYSHKNDYICGSVDEYGFMDANKYITVSEMTEDEKIIWLKLKLKEAETLKKYD